MGNNEMKPVSRTQWLWWLPLLITVDALSAAKLVETATVQRMTVTKSVLLLGQLKANRTSELYAEVDGEVSALCVADNASVVKGQVIATLAHHELRQQLALRQAATELARDHHDRLLSLQQQDGASSQAVADAKSAWIQNEIAYHDVKQSLEKTFIKASFSGTLGPFQISEGAMVKHGDVLNRIHDTSAWLVEFFMPASLISKVRMGQTVWVGADQGTIESLQASLDSTTHQGLVKARIKACSHCLVGDTVKVRVVTDRKTQVLAVPNQAVFADNQHHQVYVVKNNQAHRVTVTLGLQGTESTEIIQGLAAGDVVVSCHPARLWDGIEVITAP